MIDCVCHVSAISFPYDYRFILFVPSYISDVITMRLFINLYGVAFLFAPQNSFLLLSAIILSNFFEMILLATCFNSQIDIMSGTIGFL